MPPTVIPLPCSRRAAFVAALVAPALLTGCGLSDYERKMRDAEVRVQRFDDENKLLGDPLNLPSDGATVDVFLRPPKGVKTAQETQPGELAYHYLAVKAACTDLYLTFGNPADGKENLERRIEESLGVPGQTWQHRTASPPERAPIDFDAVEFFDPLAAANSPTPAFYRAYVHQSPGQAAAGVVFRVLESNRTAAADPIQRSLESYADAADAGKAREAYGRRRSH